MIGWEMVFWNFYVKVDLVVIVVLVMFGLDCLVRLVLCMWVVGDGVVYIVDIVKEI